MAGGLISFCCAGKERLQLASAFCVSHTTQDLYESLRLDENLPKVAWLLAEGISPTGYAVMARSRYCVRWRESAGDFTDSDQTFAVTTAACLPLRPYLRQICFNYVSPKLSSFHARSPF